MDGFEEIKVIGRGSFADVYLVRNKTTNELIAQKRANASGNSSKNDKEAMMNEAYVLEELRRSPHPSLIESRGFFQVKEYLYIFMEYCDGGDLAALIKLKKEMNQLFDEDKLLDYINQIASGAAHLHKLSIIHRDVNPSNILISSTETLKLAGFGASVILNSIDDGSDDVVGTPYYMAPEVMNTDERYDYHCDIWSLGVVAYELAELQRPFEAHNLLSLMTKVREALFNPLNERWSSFLQRLVAVMLNKNQKKRPHASAIVEYISAGQVPDPPEPAHNSDAFVGSASVDDEFGTDEVDEGFVGSANILKPLKASSGHVMISYSHSDSDKMLHVKSVLQKLGHPIWLDENNMGFELLESMARAVEDACAVVICFSEKYVASENCRKEAKYADQKKKPMIFVRMQADYKPDGFLGIMMCDAVWLDFSGKQSLDKNKGFLAKRLREIVPGDVRHEPAVEEKEVLLNLDATSRPSSQPHEHEPRGSPAALPAISLTSTLPLESILNARGGNSEITYQEWKSSEVAAWFKENGLEAHAAKFSYLDGRLLQQMVTWNQTDPAVLRKQLADAGLHFEDSLRMTAALQSLAQQSYQQMVQSVTCSLM